MMAKRVLVADRHAVACWPSPSAPTAGVLFQATRNGGMPIEPDYYRKAVAWDSAMAQCERNGALGLAASRPRSIRPARFRSNWRIGPATRCRAQPCRSRAFAVAFVDGEFAARP